jgi:hypothetical protein
MAVVHDRSTKSALKISETGQERKGEEYVRRPPSLS